MAKQGTIFTGDALAVLRTLPDKSVHCCVTSPPYWGLRDYGIVGQIGLEASPSAYVAALIPVFEEVRRVLRDDGTLWLNLGDSYIGYHGNKNTSGPAPSDKPGYRENMRETTVGMDGLKNKDLAGIPWRVAFALQDAGWYLRCDCVWAKSNPLPESVKDRPTRAHEYIFLLSKGARYYYDHEAVREPAVGATPHNLTGGGYAPSGQSPRHGRYGKSPCRTDATRARRSVWTLPTKSFPGAHFATFPPNLIRPCILAGSPVGGVVLDPFFGTGTTGAVCVETGRHYIGIELNQDYAAMASQRIEATMRQGAE